MFSKNKWLNEFLLFGHFRLNPVGRLRYIELDNEIKAKIRDDEVEDFKTFVRDNPSIHIRWADEKDCCIPAAGSVCPCCLKEFTIEDVKNRLCVEVSGKIYHDSCWRNYKRLGEIDLFASIIDTAYEPCDYVCELLPNGYCQKDCHSHIPWFLFHTIDGDIIIGARKRVISIEWQENYKSFDVEKLFKKEDVTKWADNGKQGIHAWDEQKAEEYLQKVRRRVSPSYRREK